MPTRTRHGPSTSTTTTTTATATATEPADPDPDTAPANGAHRLKFNQPLSWRVGRAPIPVADLLQRLRSLAEELRGLDQETVDKDSLRKVSRELATAQLLGHKDKGVRAWTTCCIVDLLRLCAPDAPFTGNQLKDLFTCIVTSIIPALADPSHVYNSQHLYVLHLLAEVKSIVLLTDLDRADSLIVPLFTSCFDIVSNSSKASTGEQVAKNVEYEMTRLLVTIIDESPVLAPEVVDVIVAQFLRVDPRAVDLPGKKGKRPDVPLDAKQDTLLLKDYPPAYNMAKAICQACPERMTSHISQYFNNVIIDASAPPAGATNGSSSSKHAAHRKSALDESDEESEDIKELSKAHRLIRELWRACPEVLQNVIPQLEAELSAESVSLRLLATQTIGDLAAGIGVAGPPPRPPMDPVAYPPVTVTTYQQMVPQPSVLLTPLAPKPFSHVHGSAYESFLSRRMDKSASVRSAWATAAGRIVVTSAGGSGLSEHEEEALIKNLTNMLRDVDEKVRVAAVDAFGTFGYSQVVSKLGAHGNFSNPDSVLSVLAERVKDRKPQVREHAMKTLARMWAVASGDIEQNHEVVTPLLKDTPSKIFDAYYTNDMDIHALIDRVLYEFLLPLNYPPVKTKAGRTTSNQSQKQQKDSQISENDGTEFEADKIRVRRILTLLKGLDDKAKKVFFAMQLRQLNMRKTITAYLQACEEYNGGVNQKNSNGAKAQLSHIVDTVAKMFPDTSRASADLWKFAKVHDRRNYQLIRFAMAANSDYRTVTKAVKEMARRLQSSNNAALLETLTTLVYRCSSLIFNRSHVPAIMSLSKTDEHGLGNAAQEMLKEISSRNPEVLEAQVQEMCKDVEAQAPQDGSTDQPGAEEILKACSGFAKKLAEKLPKERKFFQALANYALYSSSPRAAKHAVSILMAIADKKEMYAKDLVRKCISKWSYGSNDRFLTKLAALSQLCLLAPTETDDESDAILAIAMDKVLLVSRSPQPDSGYIWSQECDEETSAKEWALKIVVNRLRAKAENEGEEHFRTSAEPVYKTLNRLVADEGEISKKKDTPAAQKSRLRLLAAKSILKLCATHSVCDRLLTPRDFNAIALMAQDPLLPVRSGFISHLKKLLGPQSRLSHRWYTIPCLLAFEPSASLKDSALTWLRSRAALFARPGEAGQQTVMESIFSRLLSLLAYHPDYPSSDLDEATQTRDLADFARYILFYLMAVANERNLSLIFHIAQRVKQTRDGITHSDEISTRLHTLSDLAQATIQKFADIYSQQHRSVGGTGGINILETYPGKMGLPSSIFAPMTSHKEAQEVAEKNFLPEDLDDLLDRIVRAAMRPPKSTSSHANAHAAQSQAKKRKSETAAGATPTAAANGSGTGDGVVAKKVKREKTAAGSGSVRKSSSSNAASTPKKTARKQSKKKRDDEWSSDDGDGDDGRGDRVGISAADAAAAAAAARRRSSRGTARKSVSYADRDSDEDDQEMEEWDQNAAAAEGGQDGQEDEQHDGNDGQGQGQDESSVSELSEVEDEEEAEKEPTTNGDASDAEDEVLEDADGGRAVKADSKVKSKAGKKANRTASASATTATTTLPTRRSTRRG